MSRSHLTQIPTARLVCGALPGLQHLLLILVLSGFLGLSAGCSEIEFAGSDAAVPYTITVVPGNVTLTLEGSQVATQAYRAFGFFSGAAVEDSTSIEQGLADATVPAGGVEITNQVEWSVELSTIGRFQGSEFRTEVQEGSAYVPAHHGGKTSVLARLAGIRGSASLTVKYKNTFYGGSATSGAKGKFTGSKVGTITFVYPTGGTLVPPNLGQLEIQYNKGTAANNLFHIQIVGPLSTVDIYTTQSSHNLNLKQWKAVGYSNAGQTVSIVVEGTSSTSPTRKYVSAPLTLKIADTNIRGGMYYWVVSKPEGIYRYDFENPTEKSEAFYTRTHAKDCVGCHSLSRGGERVAFTKSGTGGNSAIIEVKTRAAIIDNKYRADLHTFDPEGDEVIVARGGKLERRKVKTGEVIETVPTGSAKVTHPDWGPKGNLVYVSVANPKDYGVKENGNPIQSDIFFKNGSITLLTRSSSSGKWGTPRVLVKGGGGINYYYPTFSPEGDWIVFNRSTGDSYSDQNAIIYVIKPSGQGLRALAKVNATNMSNSWPRWSPFTQTYQKTTLYWLTFSSVRNYGVKLLNSSKSSFLDKLPQIWMTAFVPSLADKGQDPVYPPCWLPFQDVTTRNHIAQWTQKVVAVQ